MGNTGACGMGAGPVLSYKPSSSVEAMSPVMRPAKHLSSGSSPERRIFPLQIIPYGTRGFGLHLIRVKRLPFPFDKIVLEAAHYCDEEGARIKAIDAGQEFVGSVILGINGRCVVITAFATIMQMLNDAKEPIEILIQEGHFFERWFPCWSVEDVLDHMRENVAILEKDIWNMLQPAGGRRPAHHFADDEKDLEEEVLLSPLCAAGVSPMMAHRRGKGRHKAEESEFRRPVYSLSQVREMFELMVVRFRQVYAHVQKPLCTQPPHDDDCLTAAGMRQSSCCSSSNSSSSADERSGDFEEKEKEKKSDSYNSELEPHLYLIEKEFRKYLRLYNDKYRELERRHHCEQSAWLKLRHAPLFSVKDFFKFGLWLFHRIDDTNRLELEQPKEEWTQMSSTTPARYYQHSHGYGSSRRGHARKTSLSAGLCTMTDTETYRKGGGSDSYEIDTDTATQRRGRHLRRSNCVHTFYHVNRRSLATMFHESMHSDPRHIQRLFSMADIYDDKQIRGRDAIALFFFISIRNFALKYSKRIKERRARLVSSCVLREDCSVSPDAVAKGVKGKVHTVHKPKSSRLSGYGHYHQSGFETDRSELVCFSAAEMEARVIETKRRRVVHSDLVDYGQIPECGFIPPSWSQIRGYVLRVYDEWKKSALRDYIHVTDLNRVSLQLLLSIPKRTTALISPQTIAGSKKKKRKSVEISGKEKAQKKKTRAKAPKIVRRTEANEARDRRNTEVLGSATDRRQMLEATAAAGTGAYDHSGGGVGVMLAQPTRSGELTEFVYEDGAVGIGYVSAATSQQKRVGYGYAMSSVYPTTTHPSSMAAAMHHPAHGGGHHLGYGQPMPGRGPVQLQHPYATQSGSLSPQRLAPHMYAMGYAPEAMAGHSGGSGVMHAPRVGHGLEHGGGYYPSPYGGHAMYYVAPGATHAHHSMMPSTTTPMLPTALPGLPDSRSEYSDSRSSQTQTGSSASLTRRSTNRSVDSRRRRRRRQRRRAHRRKGSRSGGRRHAKHGRRTSGSSHRRVHRRRRDSRGHSYASGSLSDSYYSASDSYTSRRSVLSSDSLSSLSRVHRRGRRRRRDGHRQGRGSAAHRRKRGKSKSKSKSSSSRGSKHRRTKKKSSSRDSSANGGKQPVAGRLKAGSFSTGSIPALPFDGYSDDDARERMRTVVIKGDIKQMLADANDDELDNENDNDKDVSGGERKKDSGSHMKSRTCYSTDVFQGAEEVAASAAVVEALREMDSESCARMRQPTADSDAGSHWDMVDSEEKERQKRDALIVRLLRLLERRQLTSAQIHALFNKHFEEGELEDSLRPATGGSTTPLSQCSARLLGPLLAGDRLKECLRDLLMLAFAKQYKPIKLYRHSTAASQQCGDENMSQTRSIPRTPVASVRSRSPCDSLLFAADFKVIQTQPRGKAVNTHLDCLLFVVNSELKRRALHYQELMHLSDIIRSYAVRHNLAIPSVRKTVALRRASAPEVAVAKDSQPDAKHSPLTDEKADDCGLEDETPAIAETFECSLAELGEFVQRQSDAALRKLWTGFYSAHYLSKAQSAESGFSEMRVLNYVSFFDVRYLIEFVARRYMSSRVGGDWKWNAADMNDLVNQIVKCIDHYEDAAHYSQSPAPRTVLLRKRSKSEDSQKASARIHSLATELSLVRLSFALASDRARRKSLSVGAVALELLSSEDDDGGEDSLQSEEEGDDESAAAKRLTRRQRLASELARTYRAQMEGDVKCALLCFETDEGVRTYTLYDFLRLGSVLNMISEIDSEDEELQNELELDYEGFGAFIWKNQESLWRRLCKNGKIEADNRVSLGFMQSVFRYSIRFYLRKALHFEYIHEHEKDVDTWAQILFNVFLQQRKRRKSAPTRIQRFQFFDFVRQLNGSLSLK